MEPPLNPEEEEEDEGEGDGVIMERIQMAETVKGQGGIDTVIFPCGLMRNKSKDLVVNI